MTRTVRAQSCDIMARACLQQDCPYVVEGGGCPYVVEGGLPLCRGGGAALMSWRGGCPYVVEGGASSLDQMC